MEENKEDNVIPNNKEPKVNDIGYIMSGEDSAAAPNMDAKYMKPTGEAPIQPPAQPAYQVKQMKQ